jgi:hypothetical protein
VSRIIQPRKIGTKKQLFFDNEIIEDIWGLKRSWFQARKHPDNPLIEGRYPWEAGGVRMYGTVLRENGKFRMWYNGRLKEPSGSRICYADSEDGLRWERPNLGLHPYDGSTENNITLMGEGKAGGPSTMRDDADPDEARRYKMVYLDSSGVCLAFSPDGLEWNSSPANPIHRKHNDTHLVLLKGLDEEKWFIYGRPETYAGHWKRRVAVSESKDLENWTEFTNVLVPDELDPPESYYMAVFPYEDAYVGMLAPYRNATSSSMDVQLASSRDGYHWQRPLARDSFIPLGNIGQFDSHIIWVASGPVTVGDELWFYYCGFKGRHDWGPHQASIGLATLRLDGFVCLDATDPLTVGEAVSAAICDLTTRGGHTRKEVIWPDVGHMITRPFIWEGTRLGINAWAPEGEGSVRVEVLDAEAPLPEDRPGIGMPMRGKPMHHPPFTGYGLERCDPFSGDDVRHTVTWQGASDLSHLRGKTVRLHFVLSGARLFAFQASA